MGKPHFVLYATQSPVLDTRLDSDNEVWGGEYREEGTVLSVSVRQSCLRTLGDFWTRSTTNGLQDYSLFSGSMKRPGNPFTFTLWGDKKEKGTGE